MRAKLVVFPIKGRNWCFSQSIDPSKLSPQSPNTPSTLTQLYSRLKSSASNNNHESRLEVLIDFVANKMNGAWSNLEKAPEGTFKSKIHGFGVKLLSRVKPSEIFFKSIPKEMSAVDIIYPPSLNPRLVRRRLRHIAFRGSVIHKRYLYGSAALLPLSSVFMVLPLPNIPFFWILFRAYSHYRASQGSEKLLQLVTNNSDEGTSKGTHNLSTKSGKGSDNRTWALQPSVELQKLLQDKDTIKGLGECTITKICQKFFLKTGDVVKYKDSM